jgi:hypothetical protein
MRTRRDTGGGRASGGARVARAAVLRAAVLLAAVLLTAEPAGAQGRGNAATGSVSSVSLGVAVVPETVTVGDPFRVVVRVRAPRGSTLLFPSAPDSGTGVEALDPVQVVPSSDTSAVEQTATYRMAAWDVGALAIRLPEVVLRDASGEQRLPVGARLRVHVSSVLPADSSERVPTPARALYEFGPPWWWWLLVGLAAMGVVGLLWWLWRRRRRVVPVPILTPREEAETEFVRIEALELVASGERGLHVSLMVDVVRGYLWRVLPRAAASLTTSELLQQLRGDARLPLARLSRLLHDVDLVKFAAAPIDAAHATAAGEEAKALVVVMDAALQSDGHRQEAA